MNDEDLLESWPQTRQHPRLWGAHLTRGIDRSSLRQAAAAALADPHSPERMVDALRDAGEWENALLLLEDERFIDLVMPEDVERWRSQIEAARASALAEAQATLEALRTHAERLGVAETVSLKGERRGDDERALRRLAERIAKAEETRRQRLFDRADQTTSADMPEQMVAAWRQEIKRLAGVHLDAAEAAIARGPTSDLSSVSDLPAPPPWPYRQESTHEVLGWFFGEGARPPGFDRHLPPRRDTQGWRLLEVLYRSIGDQGDAALRCLGPILGTTTTEVTRDILGWSARLADLSAPGFYALGQGRWPQGVRVWLPIDPTHPDPDLSPGDVQVRLTREGAPHPKPGHLHLSLHDLLAVLALPFVQRRRAILAVLGRQLPLDWIFDRQFADLSVRWPRDTHPDILTIRTHPVLVSAPAGMGKTVLLQELAEQAAVSVISAAVEELPERDVLLIDDTETLDPRGARRLLQAIHWARDRDPPPAVVVVARPEVAQILRRVRRDYFREVPLVSRSHSASSDQIATMLAWGDIRPEHPSLIDRLAHLSGGNPRLMFHLCEALATHLARERRTDRRFDEQDVMAAWQSERLRSTLRTLLWEPILAVDGIAQVAKALMTYGTPGEPMPWGDLAWAVGDCGSPQPLSWIEERVELLRALDFISSNSAGVSLKSHGPALLLRHWVGADGMSPRA